MTLDNQKKIWVLLLGGPPIEGMKGKMHIPIQVQGGITDPALPNAPAREGYTVPETGDYYSWNGKESRLVDGKETWIFIYRYAVKGRRR